GKRPGDPRRVRLHDEPGRGRAAPHARVPAEGRAWAHGRRRGIPPQPLAAVGAGADQDDLVLVHRVAEATGNAVDRALQPQVAERLDLAAVAAHEVVVVIAVGLRRLEARDPVTGVDALDEP